MQNVQFSAEMKVKLGKPVMALTALWTKKQMWIGN